MKQCHTKGSEIPGVLWRLARDQEQSVGWKPGRLERLWWRGDFLLRLFRAFDRGKPPALQSGQGNAVRRWRHFLRVLDGGENHQQYSDREPQHADSQLGEGQIGRAHV